MISESTIHQIKLLTPQDLELHGVLTLAGNGKSYNCPFCDNGTGKSGTGLEIHDKGENGEYLFHCMKCGAKGTNIHLLAQKYGLDSQRDFNEICKRASADFKLTLEDSAIERKTANFFLQSHKSVDPAERAKLIQLDIIDAQQHLSALPIDERRGLTLETLEYFGCGCLKNWKHPDTRGNDRVPATRRLIIPHEGTDGYLASMYEVDRNADNQQFHKQHGGNKGIFGLKTITDATTKVLVFEGEIDAMSAWQVFNPVFGFVGFIASGGAANTGWLNYLDAHLEGKRKPATLILFDADDAGKTNAAKVEVEMRRRGYPAFTAFFPDVCKGKTDANAILRSYGDNNDNPHCLFDMLRAAVDTYPKEEYTKVEEQIDRQQLFSSIAENAPESPTTPAQDAGGTVDPKSAENAQIEPSDDCTMGEYFSAGLFDAGVNELRQYATRESGFDNLDAAIRFVPGLYLIGAVPGAGKTTFAYQLLEQFAIRGENCIYLSIEMTRQEMYAKTLARRLFQSDRNATLSAYDIRTGGDSATLREIKLGLLKEKSSLRVVECADLDIAQICKRVKVYCADKAPIVCVDYLQRIKPVKAPSDNLKLAMDEVSVALKDLQKETQATIIAISSFNRENYYKPAAYSSFKESGGIEYSADGLMALEYKDVEIEEGKRVRSGESAKETPRRMRLVILKNRNGKLDSLNFNYYAAHDTFEAAKETPSVIKLG